MMPASESGRCSLVACITSAEASRQTSTAAVAPSAGHTRCMSSNTPSSQVCHDSCRSTLTCSSTALVQLSGGASWRAAGHVAQAAAQRFELVVLDAAAGAGLEVLADQQLQLERQLAVVERVELVAHRRRRRPADHSRDSCRSVRSACRARVSRDFTVPTAMSSEKAISS